MFSAAWILEASKKVHVQKNLRRSKIASKPVGCNKSGTKHPLKGCMKLLKHPLASKKIIQIMQKFENQAE